MNAAVQTGGFLVLVGIVCCGLFVLHRKRERRREGLLNAVKEQAATVGTLIQRSFLVQPCPSCEEFLMRLIELSPNARSVQYECVHCGKKARAVAGTPTAQEAIPAWNSLIKLVQELRRTSRSPLNFTLEFETTRGALPYEQTTREPIPSSIRSEVWRRDQAKCAACGSKSNLQFDHIIPVSRGGATSVQNLQLLCLQCNLSKAATI
jgi:hypothetical protein